MKKRILTLTLAAGMLLAVTGCGKTAGENKPAEGTETAEQTTESAATDASSKEYNSDDYVTLGNYEDVSVTVDVYKVTDEDVDTEAKSEFEYYVTSNKAYEYVPIDKDTVEEGDMVNIDYKGLKDGVAFDGGTAQGHHLVIGSGQFIDGFESGLVGHKVGEDVSLNLTFPEEYHTKELAGAAVVFEVKINAIEEERIPELTDASISSMGLGVSTVAEYKQNVRDYLQQQCDEKNASEKKTAVWEAVFATCTVKEPPQELVDVIHARMQENLTLYAQQYGISEDEFIINYLGTTREEYEVASKESAVTAAQEKLATAAIAKKANIEVTDADITESAAKDATQYGYESADALLAEKGKGNYYDYLLGEKVDEYLEGVVKITENTPISLTEALQKQQAQQAEE